MVEEKQRNIDSLVMQQDISVNWRAIDWHIKAKLKMRRMVQDIALDDLASSVGLATETLQRYESGQDRVEAAKLWLLSQKLQVPLSYFFEGCEELEDECEDAVLQLEDEHSIELLKRFYSIADSKVREALLELMRMIEESKSD